MNTRMEELEEKLDRLLASLEHKPYREEKAVTNTRMEQIDTLITKQTKTFRYNWSNTGAIPLNIKDVKELLRLLRRHEGVLRRLLAEIKTMAQQENSNALQ